jgi:hypothetical protein
VPWVPADADAGASEIAWQPGAKAAAVVFEKEGDLHSFLTACPAISQVAVLWPRIDVAKTFMRLAENGDWRMAAEAFARFTRAGSLVTVQQLG